MTYLNPEYTNTIDSFILKQSNSNNFIIGPFILSKNLFDSPIYNDIIPIFNFPKNCKIYYNGVIYFADIFDYFNPFLIYKENYNHIIFYVNGLEVDNILCYRIFYKNLNIISNFIYDYQFEYPLKYYISYGKVHGNISNIKSSKRYIMDILIDINNNNNNNNNNNDTNIINYDIIQRFLSALTNRNTLIRNDIDLEEEHIDLNDTNFDRYENNRNEEDEDEDINNE